MMRRRRRRRRRKKRRRRRKRKRGRRRRKKAEAVVVMEEEAEEEEGYEKAGLAITNHSWHNPLCLGLSMVLCAECKVCTEKILTTHGSLQEQQWGPVKRGDTALTWA